MKKILNFYPEKSWPNFGIAAVSLILSLPLMFAYLPAGWHVAGVVLFLTSVGAWVRYFKQSAAGK